MTKEGPKGIKRQILNENSDVAKKKLCDDYVIDEDIAMGLSLNEEIIMKFLQVT